MNIRAIVALFGSAFLAACSQGTGVSETGVSEQAPPTESKSETFLLGPIDEAKLRERIETLASDEFEGRAPATEGGRKTREYLITEMRTMGLAPANGDSYEQKVPLVETTMSPGKSFFSIGEKKYAYGTEAVYWTKRVSEQVSFEESDVVFVGYGIVAPEYGWDDYAGIDAAGKTVVMLVNDPGFATQNPDLFKGNAMTYYGRWTYKYEEAARQGAAAAIVIHQTAPAAYGWSVVQGGWTGPQIDLVRQDGGAGRAALEGWIQENEARALFASAGQDFDALTQSAATKAFKAVPLNVKASGELVNTIRRSESTNVAGILEGDVAPDEYVLYTAHWDHLGGTALGRDAISNGAVDNATGTAGILSIAEQMVSLPHKPRRSVLFLAVTAEESGLLGSAYFAEDPLVPLASIVGGINIDAILPLPMTKNLVVTGFGASELEDVLEVRARQNDLYISPDPEPEKGYFYRSDHISLAKKGVPMLYTDLGPDLVDGGVEAGKALGDDYRINRYHRPADEYDVSWDMSGTTMLLGIMRDVGLDLAQRDDWPNWYEGNEFRALRDAQRQGAE